MALRNAGMSSLSSGSLGASRMGVDTQKKSKIKQVSTDDPRQQFLSWQKDSWLKYHGKTQYLNFSQREKEKLKNYYDSMALNHRAVGLPQLEDFLIGTKTSM